MDLQGQGLKGRRALVTGSTSGIGLGIAEQLAGAGCDVVLNGFGDAEAIRALQRRLGAEYGVRVGYVAADVSKAEDCRALVEKAVAQLGGVDILVNNAGIQHVAPVETFSAERWDAVLAVNLSSAFYLTSAVVPAMRAAGYGRIVNIASVHGLIGLTKVVALETAGQGITCNAICPGWVLTPLVEAQVSARMAAEGIERRAAEIQMLAEKQPSGEFARPEDIGALAVFLCSAAAGNITGSSLPIDGAWTAQ